MKRLRVTILLFCGWSAMPAAAQDATAVWNAVAQPAFDPSKSANIANLSLTRDRIHITLTDGVIQFSLPINGVVFGAAFQGHGRLKVSAPDAVNQQQLRFFTKQSSLDMSFTEATFTFTDATFEEVAHQVQWTAAAGARLGDLYQNRQREREDHGAEVLPRLFQGVLSADHERTAYFAAEVKTADAGWVLARYDALEPEEIKVDRWTDWVSFRAFDTWASFPAGDRKASEAFRDPLAKSDFQINAYQIDATATGGAELIAAARVHLQYRASGERVLRFGLDSNLRIESVKDEKGSALPFFQARERKDRNQSYGDYVAVVLSRPSESGGSETLEFRYSGKRVIRKVGNGNYFCQSELWYPELPRSFATRTNFEMTFRNPRRYTLVATGNKTSETTDGDWTISTWNSDIPLAVAGFAFGDYKVYADKVGSIDVEVYANRNPDDFLSSIQLLADNPLPRMGGAMAGRPAMGELTPARMAKTIGIEVGNMLRVDEQFFGPYPYKRLAVTNIPYSYGQGWPTLLYLSALSFLDSTQRHNLGLQDQIEFTDFFRAHETSHQWWGHRVGWKSYHDQWLSEGFAQFSGNLYVQFRENPKEYLNRLKKDRELLLQKNRFGHVYESLGPVWMGQRLASSRAPDGYGVVVYNKGGYILQMLRWMLFDPRNPDPDHAFKAMMQDFCQTFDNKPASTEDFKAVAEKHMTGAMDLDNNHRLDWFFRQYVYGTGVPQYTFSYQVEDAGGGRWKISGSVSRSHVPDNWKDILPLYIHLPGRVVRLGWIGVTSEKTPFSATLPVRPEKLSLNDNEDILAEIKQ